METKKPQGENVDVNNIVSGDVELVGQSCAEYLDNILKNFKVGSKITLIIRQPNNDTADFTLGNDDWHEVKKVADRCISGFNKHR